MALLVAMRAVTRNLVGDVRLTSVDQHPGRKRSRAYAARHLDEILGARHWNEQLIHVTVQSESNSVTASLQRVAVHKVTGQKSSFSDLGPSLQACKVA